MTLTIVIGWWVAPALLTLAFLAGVRLFGTRMALQNGGAIHNMIGAMVELLCYAAALILSLLAWLVWALI